MPTTIARRVVTIFLAVLFSNMAAPLAFATHPCLHHGESRSGPSSQPSSHQHRAVAQPDAATTHDEHAGHAQHAPHAMAAAHDNLCDVDKSLCDGCAMGCNVPASLAQHLPMSVLAVTVRYDITSFSGFRGHVLDVALRPPIS